MKIFVDGCMSKLGAAACLATGACRLREATFAEKPDAEKT